MVKKSTILLNLVRAAVVVAAYNHLILPKQNAIPAATMRSGWWSLKNMWKMGRLRWQMRRR